MNKNTKKILNDKLEKSLFGASYGISSKSYVLFMVFNIYELSFDKIEPNNFSRSFFSSRYCLFGSLKHFDFQKKRDAYEHYSSFSINN